MSSDLEETSSSVDVVTSKMPDFQRTKKAPYPDTATAIERYPNILRGNPKTRMLFCNNTHEPRCVHNSRPTRQQLITLLDQYISDSKTIRFTAMPIPKHTNEMTVTLDDTLEDHDVEKGEITATLTLFIWYITCSMRVRRLLFGHFRELYILSLN
jgi:hypothetical protein